MSRGVTLIELMVTLSLLAVVGTGVFGLYTTATLASRHAQDVAVATGLAQARMEQVKTNPSAFTATGDSQVTHPTDVPGYRWATEATTAVAPGLNQVTVTVFWVQRGRQRHVTLTTLVRTPKAP